MELAADFGVFWVTLEAVAVPAKITDSAARFFFNFHSSGSEAASGLAFSVQEVEDDVFLGGDVVFVAFEAEASDSD